MRLRPIVILLGGLAAALTLTACGDNAGGTDPGHGMNMGRSSSSSSMAGEGEAIDIAFAQLMIPHHQQAVAMADLALQHAKSADVQSLAAQIKSAQGPEIEQMKAWLDEWGAPMEMSEGEHEMGGMTMSGMMTDDAMDVLAESRGAGFDRMWLQMMIAHHQGAIQMAQDVLEESSNDEVTALAQAIVDGQAAEIDTMQQLLAR